MAKRFLSCVLAVSLAFCAWACQSDPPEGSFSLSSSSGQTSGLSPDGKTYWGQHFSFAVPEGWNCREEETMVILTPQTYPTDVSTISVLEYEKDPNFESYTQKDFESEYAHRFNKATFSSFVKGTFQDHPSYTMEYTIVKGGATSLVTQYLVDTESGTVLLTLLCGQETTNALSRARETFLASVQLR